MPTKEEPQPSRWRGDEVEDAPPGEAERGAERAEGNTPVRADAEPRRADPSSDEDAEDERCRRPPSGETAEEKIAEAAEAHRERASAGNRPPHVKL